MAVSSLKRVKKAQGVLDDGRPVSVIDIGSNSVRMVIYENRKRYPAPLFNEKVLCGLGRSVASTGYMGKRAVERALRALVRFKAIADHMDANPLHIVATAAAREAGDGAEFLRRAEEICKARVNVLSGKEEAKLAAAGIVSGIRAPDGIAGDLGGGSLELARVTEKGCEDWVTLPLGGLRLAAEHKGDFEAARKAIAKQLDSVEWLKTHKQAPFYAIGGTWRALARVHITSNNYPMNVLQEYRISKNAALKLTQTVADHPVNEPIPGDDEIPSSRREIMPYGAIVLQEILKRQKPKNVVISAFGIREGLLYKLLPKSERERDPLLAACDNLSVLRSRSPKHARELCDWTDALFDKTGLSETADLRRIRHATCLVSDVAWRTHPDYRSKQSVSIITNGSFAWCTHAERAYMALALYYRHEGLRRDPEISRLKELLEPGMDKRSKVLGAALRTAHMISIGGGKVLPKTELRVTKKKLILDIPKSLAAFDGERLTRRFAVLAGVMDREPEIRVDARKINWSPRTPTKTRTPAKA